MATVTTTYGTETAITATNLQSLANNAAKPLPAVDNSTTKAVDYKVYFESTLAAASVSSTGTLEVYLIEGSESTSTTTDWTDGIDPAGTGDIASSLKNARLLRIFNANANNQVVREVFEITADLRGVTRNCPKYWALVVKNLSGAALHATAHEVTQTAIKYDVS